MSPVWVRAASARVAVMLVSGPGAGYLAQVLDTHTQSRQCSLDTENLKCRNKSLLLLLAQPNQNKIRILIYWKYWIYWNGLYITFTFKMMRTPLPRNDEEKIAHYSKIRLWWWGKTCWHIPSRWWGNLVFTWIWWYDEDKLLLTNYHQDDDNEELLSTNYHL